MRRGERSRGSTGLVVAVSLVLASCSNPGTDGPGTSAPPTTNPGFVATTGSPATTTTPGSSECDLPSGKPFIETDTVELADLGEVDGVRVRGAVYPHPDYEGRPWSQWGQGIVVSDGRFFSAIGDHHAEDGNSYIYEYDPSTNTLTTVGDVLSYVDHVPGTWGYGKIHSQMVPGPCGEIYFSTYWGSFRDIAFDGNYTGDILFRLDPFQRTLQPLGVPVEFHGQASMAAAPQFDVVYGEAVDPVGMDTEDVNRGPLFVYDVLAEEVVYTSPDEPHDGYRSILVDSSGVAYYSIGDGALQTYDPASGESQAHPDRIPGETLRAVTAPGPDGSVFGVTEDPDVLFAMRPDGSFEELGEALDYTASVALAPDGSRFYYMPGAHGDAPDWGSPLISVDTTSGEQTVVAEVNSLVEEGLGYTVGGTYNIAVSADGGTVFMGVNVGPEGDDETFGEVVLLVLDLP